RAAGADGVCWASARARPAESEEMDIMDKMQTVRPTEDVDPKIPRDHASPADVESADGRADRPRVMDGGRRRSPGREGQGLGAVSDAAPRHYRHGFDTAQRSARP